MRWPLPQTYGQWQIEGVTIAGTVRDEQTERVARTIAAGFALLRPLIAPEAALPQAVIARQEDATAMPTPLHPVPGPRTPIRLPFLSRAPEPAAVVVPCRLSLDPITKTRETEPLLLWRELARHLLYAHLEPPATPAMWAEEFVLWAAAVLVARDQQLSLAETIAAFHDGRASPPPEAFVRWEGWAFEDTLGLHKQLLAAAVGASAEWNPAWVTNLALSLRTRPPASLQELIGRS